MRSLTEKGISIIMISSELPEVIGVSDRVLVFRDGEVAAELSGDDINSTQIMLHVLAILYRIMTMSNQSTIPLAKNKLNFARLTKIPAFLPLVGLIILFACMSIFNEHFLTVNNLSTIARQVSINAIIAIGMTFAILTGGIDLLLAR